MIFDAIKLGIRPTTVIFGALLLTLFSASNIRAQIPANKLLANLEMNLSKGHSVQTSNIQFQPQSSIIDSKSIPVLDDLILFLVNHDSLLIEIRHHCKHYPPESSMHLSQKRAEIIRTYLIQEGINKDRIVATGMGMNNPQDEGKTVIEILRTDYSGNVNNVDNPR